MNKQKVSYIGQRFNRWVVLNQLDDSRLWLCKCDCGTEAVKDIYTLKKGTSQSCGCLRREVIIRRNKENNPRIIKHGMSGTPEWSAYKDARNRCNSPKNKRYKDYGGRGIKFLFTSFEQFFAELGPRPQGLSLDKINNDGNYEPGNVRWATSKEQGLNRRQTLDDLTGYVFGRLKVISRFEERTKTDKRVAWNCICSCGTQAIVNAGNLRSGTTKSCGCFRKEVTSERMKILKNKRKNEQTCNLSI